MADLDSIQEVISHWPPQEMNHEEFSFKPHRRLWSLLKQLKENPESVGKSDIAILVRHALRCEEINYPGSVPFIQFPSGDPWPTFEEWNKYGCYPSRLGQRIQIEAHSWKPSWCDFDQTLFEDAESEKIAVKDSGGQTSLPIDPGFHKVFNFENFRSLSQAESIRSIMLAPKGSTRVVLLPTGGGKSLIAYAPCLLGIDGVDSLTSIFVIPTTSLALDQVEQLKKICPTESEKIFAYHSGLDDGERGLIRKKLSNGQVRILFTSPESLVGALKSSIVSLAGTGLLKTFVIDEAHLVSQWGLTFRPEFQEMVSVWKEIRRKCPKILTLLLTATLTKEGFEELKRIYGSEEGANFEIIADVKLRPEIDCFIDKECLSEQKEERIIEAIRNTPRPAILYATKVEDVNNWYDKCLEIGLKRVGRIHGPTNAQERDSIIKKWRNDSIDLIVANSAFGVGMDKSNVRTVIQTAVPETVDRFYQEMGRGGRDGRCSASILIWTRDDKEHAERDARIVMLKEAGLPRWKTLWNLKKAVNEEERLYEVDVNTVTPGVDKESETSTNWNIQLLNLLARSGVLELVDLPVPEIEKRNDETEQDYDQRYYNAWNDYRRKRGIRLIDHNPLDKETWRDKVLSVREEYLEEVREKWVKMEKILDSPDQRSDILKEIYSFKSGSYEVHCNQPDSNSRPDLDFEHCSNYDQLFDSFIPGENEDVEVFFTYKNNDDVFNRDEVSKIIDTFKKMLRGGVRELAIPSQFINSKSRWFSNRGGKPNPLSELVKYTKEAYLIVRDLQESVGEFNQTPNVPRVSLILPGNPDENRNLLKELVTLNRKFHIIILPEDTPDHFHSERLITSRNAAIPLDSFRQLL